MDNLKYIEDFVRAELINDERTRGNDKLLIVKTLSRLGVDTNKSFKEIMLDGETPSIATITRARRKIQQTTPELKNEKVATMRAELEELYREYSKGAK